MEKGIRDSVNAFYASAAQKSVRSLCCAASYDKSDVAHIPDDVLEISYGCGSPVTLADIKDGETIIDLGSGGGIDCFIAAKKVGKNGRVFGIDMTEEMLLKAKEASGKVALNLGYDVVEFKKGFLEEIPVGNGTADIITSNCVLNLSPDKGSVLKEMYRVLNGRGRFCISDIVSDKEVPEYMRNDSKLWGECISGAMKEAEFINAARSAGFYGLTTVSKSLYREVEGIRFDSITLKGYKFKKGPECVYLGHFAIYNGPFKSVWDDDGHEYQAGLPVEVCTDTVEKLKASPYSGFFTIIGPSNDAQGPISCDPGSKCC